MEFIKKMKEDLIMVIKKYVDIEGEQIDIALQKSDKCQVLELNIQLPNN